MSSAQAERLLRQWRERFRRDPLAASVVAGLRDRSGEIWRSTFELLRQDSPEYRNSIDDEFTKESRSHCGELLVAIVAVAAGRASRSGVDPFDFVRSHAVWRARHRVPLIASLHAYRLAHRTYWSISRESLLNGPKTKEAVRALAMLSDFWIEFFDQVSAVLAEAHAIEEGLIVAQNTRAYVGLIDGLLNGSAPEGAEAKRLCALSGIRLDAPLTVIVARPSQFATGTPIDRDVTLRSIVRLLEEALPSAKFGKLIDVRDGEVVAIACSDAEAAERAAKALREKLVRRGTNRLSAAVGVGLDSADVAGIPQAFEEARLALDFTSADRPLRPFAEIDLHEYLVRRADRTAYRLIPAWAHHFRSTDDDEAPEALRTVEAFANCSFNIKQTAQRLGIHINTVYFRLNRIKKLTGIDPRTYSGTTLLLTALRLLEINQGRR